MKIKDKIIFFSSIHLIQYLFFVTLKKRFCEHKYIMLTDNYEDIKGYTKKGIYCEKCGDYQSVEIIGSAVKGLFLKYV